MPKLSRRTLVQGMGLAATGTLLQIPRPFAIAQSPPKVVIVGGGAGGASLAHMLKVEAPALDVTLIEANSIYSSSFFSNQYLAGLRSLESLNHTYAGLARTGIKVVHDVATDVDTRRRMVRTKDGRRYAYDRLVLSPGVEIKYETVPGYSRELARQFPHAYTTAAHGKRLLRRQLQGMRDGGVVVMTLPANPYRCPPAPYERACMIAHYLKTRKARAKLVILDPKTSFSKEQVFKEAFERHYKGIVEIYQSSEVDNYGLAKIDFKARLFTTRAGKAVKADVANIIPQQRAGEIAVKAGCTEGDWCPVHPATFASRRVEHVFVLGDAANAAEMPKSAFSANSQAKLVGSELLAQLAGRERYPPRTRNTCWSMLAPEDCVKIGATYTPGDGRLQPSQAFISERGESAEVRKQNVEESNGWYDSVTAEMFGRLKTDRPKKT